MPKTKHEEHFILDDVEVKYCFTCRRALPTTLKYFYGNKTKWDGLSPNCRECKGGHFLPPEGYKRCHKCGRVLEMTKNFYWNSIKEQYDSPCKDCVMAYKRENKDHINKRRRILRAENPEPFRKKEKEWRDNNPERYAARRRKQGEKESVKIQRRLGGQRHEARKKNLPATLTKEQWELCKQYFNNQCAYCGETVDSLTQDHVIPLSKGGEYTINNIVPACRSCNSSKCDRDLLEWYTPKFEHYSEKRKKKVLKYLKSNGKTQQMSLEF